MLLCTSTLIAHAMLQLPHKATSTAGRAPADIRIEILKRFSCLGFPEFSIYALRRRGGGKEEVELVCDNACMDGVDYNYYTSGGGRGKEEGQKLSVPA